MTTSSTTRALAHLYRRAGFGATPAGIEAAEKIGYETSADKLLAGLSEPDHAGSALALPQLTPLAQANVPGFSYDDYQEFTAGLQRLKESGKLRSYSVRPVPEEGWFDIDMCNTVVQMVKDLEAYLPGDAPGDRRHA